MLLKAQEETETYISDAGFYVIKQGSSAVCLSPEHLRHLLADMQNALDKQEEWWTPVERDPEEV